MNAQEVTDKILELLEVDQEHPNKSEVLYLLSKFSQKNKYTDSLIQAGKKMRAEQNTYFALGGHDHLMNAKQAEALFDKLLNLVPQPEQKTIL